MIFQAKLVQGHQSQGMMMNDNLHSRLLHSPGPCICQYQGHWSSPTLLLLLLRSRAEWKIQKLHFSKSERNFRTTSQHWFQNCFWNHDWTIILLRNLAKISYRKQRQIWNHDVPISSNFFENWDWNHVSTNHVTALITEQFLDSWSNPLSLVKFRKRILQKALSLFFYAVVFLCVKHAPSSPWIHDSQDVSMTRLLPYTCRGCELIVCLFVGLMFTSL